MRSDPFVESLLHDTAGALRLAQQRPDGISAVVYLFLCRAYEARLSSEAVCNLLGIAGDCVLNRACLDERGEEDVLDAFGKFDRLVQELYDAQFAAAAAAVMPGSCKSAGR